MKLPIIRPSQYIRYTDNELTHEERDRQERQQLLIHDAREITLAMAKAVWNTTFIKSPPAQ